MVLGGAAGTIGRESTAHYGGSEYATRIHDSGLIQIQVGADFAAALPGPGGLASFFRRAGIGGVRKDLSIPLEPAVDLTWIQALDGDAALVVRAGEEPDAYAYFRLGTLTRSARGVGAIGRLPVMFFQAEDYLPEARWSRMVQLVLDKQGWGALIACTKDAA